MLLTTAEKYTEQKEYIINFNITYISCLLLDCSQTPPVMNGILVITAQNLTSSVATLTCNDGYSPGPSSPLTAQCSDVMGWLTHGMSCMLPPESNILYSHIFTFHLVIYLSKYL